MPAEILSIHDVRFDLPEQTLFQHISFSIRPGEHVALVGASDLPKAFSFVVTSHPSAGPATWVGAQ